jgi:uncharacterized protein (TIGR01777 family)
MNSQLLWTLIGLQIAMGAFDTLYHHELTERLAWRPSQQRELRLHGVRNLLYAALFIALGWFEVHGAWAWLVIAVLAVELVITLMDFVEEDMSRKLPASERINHTLLTLNYGAILALLIPVLIEWTRNDTAIVAAFHGAWSILAALAAIGVALFGLRDLAASARVRRLNLGGAAELVHALGARHRVLITGATGFIGRRLVEALVNAGHDVTVLARNPAKAAALAMPLRIVTSLDQIPNDARLDAVINLAGESVADGLWTLSKRRCIVTSRVRGLRAILGLLSRLERRPDVLITASAIGWYGLWDDEPLTEFDGGKRCFSHRSCDIVERAAMRAERLGMRVVRLRIGLVLGTDGGFLGRLLLPFEFGLGGRIGRGTQWMSWIERDDLVRLIAHVIATPNLAGAVNATAPGPVPNWTFARELGRALHRPARLPLPAPVLRLAGDFANELLLGGQRVLPDKAEASGFKFRHETLASAFAAILGSAPRRLGSTSGWVQAMRDVMPAIAERKPREATRGLPSAITPAITGLATPVAATRPTPVRARPDRRSGCPAA